MPYKDPEKKKAYGRAYSRVNREKRKAYGKAWREVNSEKVKAYDKDYYEANREKRKSYRASEKARESHRESVWKSKGIDITTDRYNEMFKSQGGRCAVCGRHASEFKRRLSVDHCHETGQIRGLLCDPCNRGLGILGDDYDTVIRAAEYLA